YIGIFYLNSYWLIPALYFKKKYLFYIVTILILFVVVSYARPFEQLLQHQRHHLNPPPSGGFNPGHGGPHQPGGGPPQGPRGPRSMRIDIVSIFLYIMTIALG